LVGHRTIFGKSEDSRAIQTALEHNNAADSSGMRLALIGRSTIFCLSCRYSRRPFVLWMEGTKEESSRKARPVCRISRILPQETESNLDNRLECGNGVLSVFHAVDDGRDRFDLSRNSNLLTTVNNAMWGRG